MFAKDLIHVAEAEVGYIGKKSNADLESKTANIIGKFTKYAEDLFYEGYYNGNKNGFDWCCVFVDWCFWKAAGEDKAEALKVKPVSIYGAVVDPAFQEYAKIGRTSILPIEGCQAFFYDESGDGKLAHTGIVVKVEGNQITTIEGNWNDRVVIKSYSTDDELIAAYGLPKYDVEPVVPFNRGDKVRLLSDYAINGQQLADWVTDGRPLYVLSSDADQTAVTVNEDLSGITAVMRTCDVAPYVDPDPDLDPDDDDDNKDKDHLKNISAAFQYIADEFAALAEESKRDK